jgi:glutamate--cysteine ligase
MSSQTPVDATPITHVDQLVAHIASGSKPRERWVVGTEHEKFGWWPDRQTYPTFDDPRGIRPLLESLEAQGWRATREGDDIIALAKNRATITLEPAGQLELSGAPLKTIVETAAEADAHFAELKAASAPFGLQWMGIGAAPVLTPAQMPRVPKARYGIMRRYLATTGQYGLHMMHCTCSIQANFDFESPEDAMRMLRAGLYLQPLVTAAFANSPVVDGKLTDLQSFRARIWEDTDNARYVFPATLLDPKATLRAYVEWALDVPMYFISRGGKYLDYTGRSFRQFMAEGLDGYTATMGDFELHLSTLFPETRLKTHLEVRGADMGSRDDVIAMPALHMGIFYDKGTLNDCLKLFEGVDYAEWWRARHELSIKGIRATLNGRAMRDWMLDVLALSRQGLAQVEPEAIGFLDGLQARVEANESPADRIRKAWTGDASGLPDLLRLA